MLANVGTTNRAKLRHETRWRIVSRPDASSKGRVARKAIKSYDTYESFSIRSFQKVKPVKERFNLHLRRKHLSTTTDRTNGLAWRPVARMNEASISVDRCR